MFHEGQKQSRVQYKKNEADESRSGQEERSIIKHQQELLPNIAVLELNPAGSE